MFRSRGLPTLLCVVTLFTVLESSSTAPAADKDAAKEGKVAGILIDKKDDWITVKADGEDEPVKYRRGR